MSSHLEVFKPSGRELVPLTGERVTVTSEYPQDLAYALEILSSGQA